MLPEVAVDARGYLVAIVHDLQIDLPVPAQMANSPLAGAKAKIYRLDAKTAEFVFEIKPVTQPDGTIRLTGNLKELNTSPGSRVLAINDDEAKALPLDPFRSVLIYQGFANAIKAKPLDLPVQNLKLQGLRDHLDQRPRPDWLDADRPDPDGRAPAPASRDGRRRDGSPRRAAAVATTAATTSP